MELEKWIDSYKVRAFPWIDGKRIYFNVQYYAPGQSVEKPPVWDKTVYITENAAGRRLVFDFTNSLVNHIASMRSAEHVEITLTALSSQSHFNNYALQGDKLAGNYFTNFQRKTRRAEKEEQLMYPETKNMSSIQQEKVLRTFKRVIDKRNSFLIDENLYKHLYLYCDFIAHYDIHGFRATYSGREGFREFVEHFDRRHHEYWTLWLRGDYALLNSDMVNYVTEKAPQIYAELDRQQRDAELALARILFEKHGVATEPSVIVEENGQLSMGF